MRNLLFPTMLTILLGSVSLQGVEYGGEKSDLIATELQYNVCIVPPQIDEAEAKGIKVVSVARAKTLFDEGALFFDARSPRHYVTERIKGAYPVVFDRSKAKYVAINLPSDTETPVVFYCYGESCANSYEAALAVKDKGYANVYWLLNGFPQWRANAYPVERGE